MEMPEGWKRINQSISEYKTTTDTERMLDLMKEMAEALEYYAENDFDVDLGGTASETLKKFKEWK